jgi:hypothetical protein
MRWRDVDCDASKVRVVSPYVRGEFGDPKLTRVTVPLPALFRLARTW